MPTALPDRTFRFAAFELDSRSGELRKRGIKLKLQDQPLQILTLLLERAGEIVSREEIRRRLWPDNTYVDFENAISSAIRKLREALSDNPGTPRFIETVARQGYRFVCPVRKNDEDVSVEVISEPEQVPPVYGRPSETEDVGKPALDKAPEGVRERPPHPDMENGRNRSRRGGSITLKRGLGWELFSATMLVALVAAWWTGRREGSAADENPLSNATFVRLTDFPGDKSDASISPDGRFVAFRAYSGGRSDVWVGQVGTGRPVNLTKEQPEDPLLPIQNLGFSPDGSQVWLAGYRGY